MDTRLYIGNNKGSGQDSKQERLQKMLLQRAQAQRMAQAIRLQQIKIDEAERRLISVTDMDAILVEIAGALSTRLRSQPSRLMERLLPHIKPESHDELFGLLTEEATKLLEELKTMSQGGGEPIEENDEGDDAFDRYVTESDTDSTA